jgi:hypothetical protein
MKKRYRIKEGGLLWRLQQFVVLSVLSLISIAVMVGFLNVFVGMRECVVNLF